MGGTAYGICVGINAVGKCKQEIECEGAKDPDYFSPCCDSCSNVVEHARQVFSTNFIDLGRGKTLVWCLGVI